MAFQENITPGEAAAIIAASLNRSTDVTVPIREAFAQILAAPVFADQDQPPFHRVAMDGIAIRSLDFAKGIRKYTVMGMQKAGESQKPLLPGDDKNFAAGESASANCLEAMTGAVLPMGADCIIPYEALRLEQGLATVVDENFAAKPFRNVHARGSDCVAGALIVEKGARLTAQHLGAAAAFGYAELSVSEFPKVGIVATGDELVPIHTRPEAHQIRLSNGYAIDAALRMIGIHQIEMIHARDHQLELKEKITDALRKNQVVILSGGVSMGRTDYVPEVLAELAIEPLFHRIKQKPGKPFWFGMGREGEFAGKAVFALPGNPASVLVCLFRYVLPALRSAMGENQGKPFFVVLKAGATLGQKLTQFRPVTIMQNYEGKFAAEFVSHQGSGDFSNWSKSDGFVEIPVGVAVNAPEILVKFWSWK